MREEGTATENSLDFVSPGFDALRALQADDLQPPIASAEPLTSLDACRNFVLEDLESLLTVESDALGETHITASEEPEFKYSDEADSLDFFSPSFNALAALNTKGLIPPNPKVRPLDNLTRCRRILPKVIPESLANVPEKAPRSLESIAAQERAKGHKSVLLAKAAEQLRQVKIFDNFVEKLKDGPLGLLADCYHQKTRVKVWTRHSRGVRGSLIGRVVAFDKHVNMVLRDIDEEYSVRRWVPRLVRHRGRRHQLSELGGGKVEQSRDFMDGMQVGTSQGKEVQEIVDELKELRLFPKLEYMRRHLNQVFLRGDSVVMVQKLVRPD